jgi:hypothetical protein
MSPIERPSSASERKELPFSNNLDRLQIVVGPLQKPIPKDVTEADLIELQEKNIRDNAFENFNEQFRNNELIYRRAALQREARFSSEDEPSVESTNELIVANQAATYHEYFQSTVNHVLGVLRDYEAMRKDTPVIPLSLQKDEAKMEIYIDALRIALSERVSFANVLLLDGQIAQSTGNTKIALKKRRDALSLELTEVSRRAVNGDTDSKWRRGNALNQRIIDLLSGDHGIQGLEKGFLPQKLYIDLLKIKYKELLERQKAIARDPNNIKAKSRLEQLQLKHKSAKEGVGEFTDKDEEDLASVRRQIKDRNTESDSLADQRAEVIGELLSLTDTLAEYQIGQAELATIQNQFGENVDLTGAADPRPDTTPDYIKVAIDENVELRSNHHADTMTAMLDSVEENMLDPGLKEHIEDFSNKKGREIVRKVAKSISKFVTIPVPEAGGLKEYVQDALTESLDESLGWPPGKDNWEDLTPEEQENVKKKAKSVLDAIEEFDKSTITRMGETVTVVKEMPPASTFVGEEIPDPLPSIGRITPENKDALIKKYGGATVYFVLFDQMEEDFGSAEEGTGFLGEYAKFLHKINDNIDTHIDVGEALHKISSSYGNIAKGLLLAALALLGAGILTGALAAKYTGRLARFTGRTTLGAIRSTARGVSSLRNVRPPGFMTKLRHIKQERAVAQYIAETRAGKFIGNLRIFRSTRFTRGAGKVAKGIGWVAIPALTAYELHINNQRKKNIKENKDLRDEYATQDTTTLLEGAGFGATLLVATGPAIVLAIPVFYAGSVSRGKSEKLANWKRGASEWYKEFSSDGLLQGLEDIAPGTEVDNQGGGVFATRAQDLFGRATFRGKQMDRDQVKAVEIVSNANAASRGNIYEAYFKKNLLVSEGTPTKTSKQMIQDKVSYMGRITRQGYEKQSPLTLRMADAYAELMQMYRKLKAAGKPPMISYTDEKQETHYLDLSKLLSTNGTLAEMRPIVADYVYRIRPLQSLVMFNAIGEIANDHRSKTVKERGIKKAKGTIRQAILLELLHDIHEGERKLMATNFTGWEVTGEEQETRTLIRWYLRSLILKEINKDISGLMEGSLSEKQYADMLSRARAHIIDVSGPKNISKLQKTATDYYRQFGGDDNVEKARNYTKNPLYELFDAE